MTENPELLPFGAAIRQVREERGMSVNELAAEAGIPSTDIEAFEAGLLDPPLVAEHDGSERDAVSVAFGRRLRALRAEHGVSQDDLARETDVHSTAISRFERGFREPRLKSILLLARGLGVKPGELVEDLGVIEGEAGGSDDPRAR